MAIPMSETQQSTLNLSELRKGRHARDVIQGNIQRLERQQQEDILFNALGTLRRDVERDVVICSTRRQFYETEDLWKIRFKSVEDMENGLGLATLQGKAKDATRSRDDYLRGIIKHPGWDKFPDCISSDNRSKTEGNNVLGRWGLSHQELQWITQLPKIPRAVSSTLPCIVDSIWNQTQRQARELIWLHLDGCRAQWTSRLLLVSLSLYDGIGEASN